MLKLLEKRSLPLGSRVLARTGFAIGSAFGREMAEIYMHILEWDLLLANKHGACITCTVSSAAGASWMILGRSGAVHGRRRSYLELPTITCTTRFADEISCRNLIMSTWCRHTQGGAICEYWYILVAKLCRRRVLSNSWCRRTVGRRETPWKKVPCEI